MFLSYFLFILTAVYILQPFLDKIYFRLLKQNKNASAKLLTDIFSNKEGSSCTRQRIATTRKKILIKIAQGTHLHRLAHEQHHPSIQSKKKPAVSRADATGNRREMAGGGEFKWKLHNAFCSDVCAPDESGFVYISSWLGSRSREGAVFFVLMLFFDVVKGECFFGEGCCFTCDLETTF